MTNLDKLDAEISAYMQIVADIENRLVNLALQGGEVLTAEEQIFERIYKSEYDRLHAHVTSMLHKRNSITA